MKKFTFLLLALLPHLAAASEGMFGYIYTSETTPKGHWEYEQMNKWREGKARGQYTAVDMRNEMELGITNNLQGALYLNSTYLKTRRQYDPEDVSGDLSDKNEFNLNGMSFELLYRVLSPFKDPVGMALYLEPEISVRDHETGEDEMERAVEGRLILQKNFLGDTLVTATNLMVEPEWEKEGGLSQKELWVEWTLGASYRLRDRWFAGLEFRNHMEFPDFNLGNQEHSAYFLGPNVHYAQKNYWVTLAALPQIAGWPRRLGTGSDGEEISDSQNHLGQHERFEVVLKIGIPLTGEHSHED